MAFDRFDRPKQVRQAQIDGDKAKLSALGRKGAEVANKNRQLRAEHEAIFDQIREEELILEEKARAEEANEHIAPIDPDKD